MVVNQCGIGFGTISRRPSAGRLAQPRGPYWLRCARFNGYDIGASQEERAAWIISLSEGVSVDQLAVQIRAALRVQPPASDEG